MSRKESVSACEGVNGLEGSVRSPATPTKRQQTVNAMVLMYESLTTERECGCAMEAFLQFAFRAWTWNPEKFHKEFSAALNHGAG